MKDKCIMSYADSKYEKGNCTPEVSRSGSGCLNGENARAATHSSKLEYNRIMEKLFM